MPVPVITVAQMREWEQATWASGQTEAAVIRRVGELLARRVLDVTRPGDRVLIVAGKGHNGDDARMARDHLANRRVDTLDVTDPACALANLDVFLADRPALIVDGLFGIGLDRPLDADWIQLVERINKAHVPVLAVDVPSGLNADTGQPQGAAIQAAITLTVGAPKIGLLSESAWPFVGRLEVATDVGLVPPPVTSELSWTLPEDFASYPPARAVATHKGTYGYLVILAGSAGYHGAAVLAARGAQRAQPGLIRLETLEPAFYAAAPQLQSVMVSIWQPATKLAGNHTAVLVGPGLAGDDLPDQFKLLTRHLWRDSTTPVIADASALDWLTLGSLSRTGARVITPHPGEAARLLQSTPQQVQADRVGALRNLSHRFGHTWVVLKGHQTLIGRSSGEVYVNPSGNPYLAQGGSGDVLAGYVAGFLAQPALQADPLTAIRYAVWEHGAAADRLQKARPGWVIEELVEEIGARDRPTER